MKYFRFEKEYPYLALVCAHSKYEAIGLYIEEVSTIDDDTQTLCSPEELTEEEARCAYESAGKGDEEPQLFESFKADDIPQVMAWDESLV